MAATFGSRMAAREVTVSLGLLVLFSSWTMMFGALLMVYGVLRVRLDAWPPLGLPPLPVTAGAINTLALICASVLAHRALGWHQRHRLQCAARRFFAATCAGVGFVALQIASWRTLYADGLTIATGAYASVFYMLTAFHAAHVVVGVLGLGWQALCAYRGVFVGSARGWVAFWHFVGTVWLVLFGCVYLL